MWVAKSRQKPPEDNAFAKRAQLKRDGKAEEPSPEPASEPDPKAVAVPFDRNPESEEYTQAPDLGTFTDLVKDVQRSDAVTTTSDELEADKPASRGRPRSAAVQERNAKIMLLLTKAGSVGMSKTDLAAALGEKEQQVYTSLRQLQRDDMVKVENMDGLAGYRWIAV